MSVATLVEDVLAQPPNPAHSGWHPLGAFQRAMLSWERLHPYNAAHAVRVTARLEADRFQSAVAAVCRAAGVGELTIDANRKFSYQPMNALPLSIVPATPDVETSLRTALTAGLNTAFPPGPHHPIRWTLLPDGDAAHWIILAYHHVAADAQGIEALLAAVLGLYLADDDRAAAAALAVAAAIGTPPPADVLALSTPGWGSLIGGLARTLRQFRRMKFAHKMPDDRHGGDATAAALATAPVGQYERLVAACRARGVGFNDALLGAFASAIAAFTPDRHTSRRRRKIALGSVLNLRRNAQSDLSNFFGVCLSDMLLLLDRPDAPLDEVVADVARQSRELKSRSSAGSAGVSTFFAERIWPLLFIRNSRRSYRKLLPLCGGVSTFVVNAQRFAAVIERIDRYLRCCPCGPAAPLLLGPTVWRGRLELSLVHRTACLSPERAAALLDAVIERLTEIGADARCAG